MSLAALKTAFDSRFSFRNIAELVSDLRRRWLTNDEMAVVVRRSHILQDTLQRMARVSFDPAKQVMVAMLLTQNYEV